MFNRRLGVGCRLAIAHGPGLIMVERVAPELFLVTATGGFRAGDAPFARRLIAWRGGGLDLTRGGETIQLLFNGRRPREVWIHAPESFVAGRAILRRRAS